MPDLDFLEITKMFDIFLAILENPTISKQTNTNTVLKAFQCAHFIESTIAKSYEIGKDDILESCLHERWSEEQRSNLYKCSDLENACDKLLELYLKDRDIPTDVVDEFLKLYTQYCGSDRLNNFLQRTVINGICTNMIIESFEELGISSSDMQDDALIVSWEMSIENGNCQDVSDNVCKMFDEGHILKLIEFAVHLDNSNKVKQLIVQVLTEQLTKNDPNICLALTSIGSQSLCNLMQSNSEFYLNFLDAIFYFARHMKLDKNAWTSDTGFNYDHLLIIVQDLLNGPSKISGLIYNRIQLVKTHMNGEIWHDIEKHITL